MPIFEYTCNNCGRNFSALVGVVANTRPPACPKCQGNDLKKRVSRFAQGRNEDEAIDALASKADNLDPDNPAEMRQFMKQMAGEMGDEFSDTDMDEMMEDLEKGDGGGADGDGGDFDFANGGGGDSMAMGGGNEDE